MFERLPSAAVRALCAFLEAPGLLAAVTTCAGAQAAARRVGFDVLLARDYPFSVGAGEAAYARQWLSTNHLLASVTLVRPEDGRLQPGSGAFLSMELRNTGPDPIVLDGSFGPTGLVSRFEHWIVASQGRRIYRPQPESVERRALVVRPAAFTAVDYDAPTAMVLLPDARAVRCVSLTTSLEGQTLRYHFGRMDLDLPVGPHELHLEVVSRAGRRPEQVQWRRAIVFNPGVNQSRGYYEGVRPEQEFWKGRVRSVGVSVCISG